MSRYILSAMVVLATIRPSFAQDVTVGREVFKQSCSICHSVRPNDNQAGPSLFGVVGRKSASIEGYRYSEASKTSDLTWTAEELDAYLAAPSKVLPGTRMIFPGLKDEKKRAAVIAYLQTVQ